MNIIYIEQMSYSNIEQQFHEILPKLLEFPNWKLLMLDNNNTRNIVRDDSYDISARVQINQVIHHLKFEIKPRFNLNHIIPDTKIIRIYPHLKSYEAQKLIQMGVNFLDSASNAYLSFDDVYIYCKSNESPLIDVFSDYIYGDVFNPTTTSLLTSLILDPDLLEQPYREIALRAKISLGSVKKSFDILEKDRVIESAGNFGKHFDLNEDVWRKWARSYGQKLLPKRSLGRFTQVDPSKELKLKTTEGCVGAMEASTELGFGIDGPIKRVYIYDTMAEFIRRNKLRVDPKGNVQIYEANWHVSQESKPMCVPLSIVFADLLSINDPRCDEIASEIYQSKLRR